MSIEELKSEIERAYRVLGEQAEMQNYTDIDGWFSDGFINEYERDLLNRYNRLLSK